MIIRDCMKTKVFYIRPTTTIFEAASLFVEHHIGTLPVIDDRDSLVGIVLIRDLLSLIMPDFVNLLRDFNFMDDFGAVENHSLQKESLDKPVSGIMEPPISLEETSGLLRAAALLNQQNLNDIPIVDSNNMLVGITSRVDIGTALLANWGIGPGG
jgi:CBS domain-containing protein